MKLVLMQKQVFVLLFKSFVVVFSHNGLWAEQWCPFCHEFVYKVGFLNAESDCTTCSQKR